MTVSTFFPDASPETTSVDGRVERSPTPAESWASIRDGVGNGAGDADTRTLIRIAKAGAGSYDTLARYIALFDTSSLPDNDTIDAVTFEGVVIDKSDTLTPAGQIALVTSTPASNTALVTGDYAQLGTVDQAADVTIASITADSATYNVWTLNATGRGNISNTGITKFGLRQIADADNVEPTGTSGDNYIRLANADEDLAGDKRPKLVVTHTSTFTPRVIVF